MMKQKDFRIDFVGIGTGKSGTTWLAEVLRKHPDVYYPTERKEISYFNALLPQDYKTPNPDNKKGVSWYHDFFKDRQPGQISGEITPSYLSMENAAADIFNYNPDIKIFAILRHPVERSFSEYLFSKQNGVIAEKDFGDAVDHNPRKFLGTSLYYENLQPFYKLFSPENIKVFFFEDIKQDSKKFLGEVYSFLGVAPYYPEDYNEKVNVGLQAKNARVSNFIGKAKMLIHSKGFNFLIPVLKKTGILKAVKKVKEKNLVERTDKEVIPAALREKLCGYFNNDIDNLQKLTGRNLQHWKK